MPFPTPDREPGAGVPQGSCHASRLRFFCIELKPIEIACGQNWLGLSLYSTLKIALAARVKGISVLHSEYSKHCSFRVQSNEGSRSVACSTSFLSPTER